MDDDFAQLDHYELLGVSRRATTDEIKRAYRQQMARFHPDRFVLLSDEEQRYANRRALRINTAYTVLSDFQARVAYNRNLATSQSSFSSRARLATLYQQAHDHLAAERYVQAATTLRELHQVNPFYRDSAALLAQAEAAVQQSTPPTATPVAKANQGCRALVVSSLGVLMLMGLAVAKGCWLLLSQSEAVSRHASVSAGACPTCEDEEHCAGGDERPDPG